jgi:hypothetical protein
VCQQEESITEMRLVVRRRDEEMGEKKRWSCLRERENVPMMDDEVSGQGKGRIMGEKGD